MSRVLSGLKCQRCIRGAHYWRNNTQLSIRYTAYRDTGRYAAFVRFVRRRLARVYPRISSRRYTGARGSLTACVYRRLYLARAITSPSATDRTNERANEQASKRASGVNEPSRAKSCGRGSAKRRGAFSISSQPVTLRPRSHGVYIPSHATRYPVRSPSPFFHRTIARPYSRRAAPRDDHNASAAASRPLTVVCSSVFSAT